jgi:hypothetical protein
VDLNWQKGRKYVNHNWGFHTILCLWEESLPLVRFEVSTTMFLKIHVSLVVTCHFVNVSWRFGSTAFLQNVRKYKVTVWHSRRHLSTVCFLSAKSLSPSFWHRLTPFSLQCWTKCYWMTQKVMY